MAHQTNVLKKMPMRFFRIGIAFFALFSSELLEVWNLDAKTVFLGLFKRSWDSNYQPHHIYQTGGQRSRKSMLPAFWRCKRICDIYRRDVAIKISIGNKTHSQKRCLLELPAENYAIEAAFDEIGLPHDSGLLTKTGYLVREFEGWDIVYNGELADSALEMDCEHEIEPTMGNI